MYRALWSWIVCVVVTVVVSYMTKPAEDWPGVRLHSSLGHCVYGCHRMHVPVLEGATLPIRLVFSGLLLLGWAWIGCRIVLRCVFNIIFCW